jgi:hypothetical protein
LSKELPFGISFIFPVCLRRHSFKPNHIATTTIIKMQRCRASGCTFNHAKHDCYLCHNHDSDHISGNCPNRRAAVLGHGTRVAAASSISLNGLQPSTIGRLGPGIYFGTIETARMVASHRNNGTAVVVFHCQVDLGKCHSILEL